MSHSGIFVGTRKTLHTHGVELMGGWSWVEIDCDVVIDWVHVTTCFLGYLCVKEAYLVVTSTGCEWSPPRTGVGLDILEFQVTITISDALLHSFCHLLVLVLMVFWVGVRNAVRGYRCSIHVE